MANIQALRYYVIFLRQLDYEEDSMILEKDLDETEAIMKGLQETVLNEVRMSNRKKEKNNIIRCKEEKESKRRK